MRKSCCPGCVQMVQWSVTDWVYDTMMVQGIDVRSYLPKLCGVIQSDPCLDLQDGQAVADEVRGGVPGRGHQAGQQLLVVGAKEHLG